MSISLILMGGLLGLWRFLKWWNADEESNKGSYTSGTNVLQGLSSMFISLALIAPIPFLVQTYSPIILISLTLTMVSTYWFEKRYDAKSKNYVLTGKITMALVLLTVVTVILYELNIIAGLFNEQLSI